VNLHLAFWAVQVALLASVVLGGLLGWRLQRRLNRTEKREEDRHRGHLGDAVGFVGGAFGIILGLLLVFAVQHFTDAQEASRQEAVRISALFQTAGGWEPAQSHDLRRDLICATRSLNTDDRMAADSLDLGGSDITSAWLGRVRADARALPINGTNQANSHFYIVENVSALDQARQLRLLLAPPNIPLIVWFVIYTLTFVFIALMVLQIGALRRLTYISVVATWIVLAVTLATMNTLDAPLSGKIGIVEPIALTSTLNLLQESFPNEDWSTCGTPTDLPEGTPPEAA
jgi:hypothetical protein